MEGITWCQKGGKCYQKGACFGLKLIGRHFVASCQCQRRGTNRQTDIATNRLKRPRTLFIENNCFLFFSRFDQPAGHSSDVLEHSATPVPGARVTRAGGVEDSPV